MAINYDTLKTSENFLKKLFLQFFDHVLESQKFLYESFYKTKKITDKQFRYLAKCEKQANQFEAQILDEASWIISKDQPRASHLRFLIAIIKSIKDLERMGDFVDRTCFILRRQKNIDPEVKHAVYCLMKDSYEFSLKIYRNISSGPHQTKEYYTNYASKYFKSFSKSYRNYFTKIGEIIFNDKKDINRKIAIFTAIKNIERNADHAFNILENFVYIGQPDFYFHKESRKK